MIDQGGNGPATMVQQIKTILDTNLNMKGETGDHMKGCLHRHQYEAKILEHQQFQTIFQGTVDHPLDHHLHSTIILLPEVMWRSGPSQKSAPIYVQEEVSCNSWK